MTGASSKGNSSKLFDKLKDSGISAGAFCFRHADEYFNRIENREIILLNERISRFFLPDGGIEVLSEEGKEEGKAIDFRCKITITEGLMKGSSAGISLSINNWSEDAYLLLPGAAYKGNCFQSRKIPYSPKLLDEKDLWPNKEIIVPDILRLNILPGPSGFSDRSGSLSAPVIIIWLPKTKEILSIEFNPENELGDLGLIFTENKARGSLNIDFQSPVVREEYMYKICNSEYPSEDTPYDFSTGDEFHFKFKVSRQTAESLEELFTFYPSLRSVTNDPLPVMAPKLKECFDLVESKFNRSNWVEDWGYYSVGMRENFLQDWQIGWTGGMISTYPLYFLGSNHTKERVLRNFKWFFRDGFSPGGLPWDSGENGDKWYGGDIRRKQTENRHLVRKSADALYYLFKQFFMLSDDGFEIPLEWVRKLEKLCYIFLENWKKYKDVGHFLDTRNNEIVVGGSTSGAILPAGLVMAFRWTQNPEFLKGAMQIADYYYEEYLSRGIACGGPGDALQSADSESSYGLCESYVLLYEESGEKKWLDRARLAARFFSTWLMSYNYNFPAQSTHGRIDAKTKGLVYANTQNKHLAPGICCYSGAALLKIYLYTFDNYYIGILEEITRAMPQYLSTSERPINGLKEGWVSERINTTDWLEGIGETMQGSTWAETSLMLASAELPSVFADMRKRKVWCFDQLECELRENTLIIKTRKDKEEGLTINILIEYEKEEFEKYNNYGCQVTRTLRLENKETVLKI
ncbi:MAG: hypothetical protein ACOCUP_00195 [bacterium]